MSVGKEKHILSFALHVERQLMSHGVEVQGNHKIGAAQGSAGMTTLTLMDHADDVAPYLARNSIEFFSGWHFLQLYTFNSPLWGVGPGVKRRRQS